MEDTGMISSGADLASSFTPSGDTGGADTSAAGAPGADVSSGADLSFEEPGSPDAPAGEEDINYDALNDQGNPDDQEPAVDELPADPAVEPVAEPAAAEQLPEGVRKGKDRSGKDGYWLNPNRYETFHKAHAAIRDVESLIEEPFTADAIALRQKAYLGQERLYNNMLSGDPELQRDVIGHFFQEARRAQEEGEIGTNPMVPFTQQFYQTLRDNDPDAYATLRSQAAADLVDEIYLEAAQSGNRPLWLSAQHFDKVLNRQFKPETEMANLANGEGDQLARLRAENDHLRQQVQGRTQQSQAAQFETWRGGLNQNIGEAITSHAVTPALAAVKEAYKNFPEKLQWIQDRLHSRAQEAFKDAGFRGRVRDLLSLAQRATSAQKRAEIGQQIVNLHAHKARLAIDAVKGPILSEAARDLKAQSDRTHQRRQAAQQERSPAGGTPVRTSLAPVKGMEFDVATPDSLKNSLAGLFR